MVYALDTSNYALKELIREASDRKLGNVVPLHSVGELKKTLGRSRLDVLLLYDVIHGYYFSNRQRMDLLRSLTPLIKKGGIISIFPRHMSSPEIEEVEQELHSLGFRHDSAMETELLHDRSYTSGRIYNFRGTA